MKQQGVKNGFIEFSSASLYSQINLQCEKGKICALENKNPVLVDNVPPRF